MTQKTRWLPWLLLAAACTLPAAGVPEPAPLHGEFVLQGTHLRAVLVLERGVLRGERLEVPASPDVKLAGDGGFALDVVWSDWRAPGKANNADTFCRFGPADFVFATATRRDGVDGAELVLGARGPEGLALEVTYSLAGGGWALRRQLRIADPLARGHFLHAIAPLDAVLAGPLTPVHGGGFGQPVAFLLASGGAFAGLEWPAADNRWEPAGVAGD